LVALALPAEARGSVEIDADLRSAGATTRALAAGLSGHVGLAMVDGQLDNRLLSDVLGPVLRSAKLPAEFAAGAGKGRTEVRCFAARLDAVDGIATAQALTLDTPKLQVEAAGTINLAEETLALKARPLVRLSITGVAVPLDVGGTFAAPRVQIDPTAATDPNSAIAALAGVLGGRAMPELTGSDPCPAALRLARLGRDGAMPRGPSAAPASREPPAAEAQQPNAPAAKAPQAIELLKKLLR
jgi:AsmA protein